jgi:hypothetical protein
MSDLEPRFLVDSVLAVWLFSQMAIKGGVATKQVVKHFQVHIL